MKWYLVFHIIGFIFWAGGLLDISRILGYHVKEEIAVQKRLSWMEFRMFWFVSTPGLIVTWAMGLALFLTGGGVDVYLKGAGWFHGKLTAVLVLTIIHFLIGRSVMQLRAEPKISNPAKFKALHGIAGLCVVAIVILVMIKPF